eukprot:NODE_884_length_1146_cov_285.766636_g614_i0.p1 GENE.NODE_884_length_1146_cov_285.766636_g614_i0~~NODE_884_length_1146_cov_285.766636_g614_i0.p1  ORF type:complete len:290 (+),score=80.34 NODE_884_length_1146_cov_285.766636_g614_i0:35-871(+)
MGEPHVLHGYRRAPCNSLAEIFYSLFRLHNETVNIYTHLFGALAALYCTIQAQLYWFPRCPPVLRFLVFLLTAAPMCTFGISTCFHLFGAYSERVFLLLRLLDHTFILVMIICSILAPLYIAFICFPLPRTIYLTIIGTLGIIGVHSLLHVEGHRIRKLVIFALLAMFGLLPMAHTLLVFPTALRICPGAVGVPEGPEGVWQELMHMNGRMTIMYFTHALAAGLYLFRVPERFWPGGFDYVGTAHQIMHVLVMFAAAYHLESCVEMYQKHNTVLCCPA